jgi:hypothetical protein
VRLARSDSTLDSTLATTLLGKADSSTERAFVVVVAAASDKTVTAFFDIVEPAATRPMASSRSLSDAAELAGTARANLVWMKAAVTLLIPVPEDPLDVAVALS